MEDYFKNGNPEGKSKRREIFGEPMRSIPAFREPAAAPRAAWTSSASSAR
jgi:hypothetical protein